MIFYYFSLSIIFFISLFVAWEDINTKKIRNHWIVLGFVAGCLLFLIGYISGFVSSGYILKIIVNSALSLAVGFIIWRLGFWPAGDSKLFVLFSFLLPLHYYWKTYLEYFPSFVLLVNIFVLFLIFVFLKACCIFLKTLFIFLRNNNNYGKIVVKYLKKAKESGSKLKNGKFLIKVFSRFAIGILIYFVLSKFYFKTPFKFVNLLVSLAIFSTIAVLFKFYTNKCSRKSIEIGLLNSNANIADETISKLKEDKNLIKKIGRIRSDGLEKHQVDLIKNYFIKNNIKKIYVYRTIPFSLWIIAGMIVTVLFKGIIRLRF